MKKLMMTAVMAVTALTFTSCAVTLEEVPYGTGMWSATDPFGFLTLRWATNEIKRLDYEQRFRLDVTNVIAGAGIEIQHPTERTVLINAMDGEIPDGSVTTAKLADKAVTAQKVADSTITAAQVANQTITGAKLANKTVTFTQIADNTINELQLGYMVKQDLAKMRLVAAASLTALGKGVYSNPSYQWKWDYESDGEFRPLRWNDDYLYPFSHFPAQLKGQADGYPNNFFVDVGQYASALVVMPFKSAGVLRFGIYADYYDSEPIGYTDIPWDGASLPSNDVSIYVNDDGRWGFGSGTVVIRIGGKVGVLQ